MFCSKRTRPNILQSCSCSRTIKFRSVLVRKTIIVKVCVSATLCVDCLQKALTRLQSVCLPPPPPLPPQPLPWPLKPVFDYSPAAHIILFLQIYFFTSLNFSNRNQKSIFFTLNHFHLRLSLFKTESQLYFFYLIEYIM